MFKFVKKWVRQWAEEPSDEQYLPDGNLPEHDEHNAPEAPAGTHEYHYGSQAATSRADVLELPLAAVFNGLPKDLQARVKLPLDPHAVLTVPLGIIVPQLNRGSVKISFGELRELAPANTFYSQIDRDQAVVELPLAEIFPRLDPSLLPRRRQKAVEVPEEIVSPFSGNGEGLSFYHPETTPFARKGQPDFSAASEFPTRGQLMSVPPNPISSAPAPDAPIPMSAPIPMPGAPVRQPLTPSTRELVQAAAQLPAGANAAVLRVKLVELAETWPPTVRTDMAEMHLLDAVVSLPLPFVEEALKKGRAVFSWMQVRQWTNSPAVAAGRISTHDTVLLELPLKVLAPLFLTQRLAVKASQKMAVDQNIPDLFNKAGTPATKGNTEHFSARSAAPQIPPPEPSVAHGNTDRYVAPSPNLVREVIHQNGKARNSDVVPSGTDFLRRYATPNDIVGKAVGLEGVAGALITLPDGLLVASHLPPSMNPDALAGFMPQVFARLSQSAREYRVGDLKDIIFIAGETQWHIFKVGTIFFGVFGHAGGVLPAKELVALASELDRKPKTL